jgi:hypothetical protein
MILVKYLHTCIAFLQQMWSSIRPALPVVTWSSRVAPNAAPEPQTIATANASPSVPPAEATVTADSFAAALTHLEYLGYEVGLDPDGWSTAQHPSRYDFHLRTFARGIKLHCAVGIGASAGNTRAALLDFLNTANEHSHVTRFSLFEDEAGVYRIRMRAVVSGAYSRPVFAMLMDMWHDDLTQVRRMPRFVQESDDGENDDVGVIVN